MKYPRSLAVPVLVLLSTISLAAQSTYTPEQAKSHVVELVLEGERFLEDGNINAALANFRQARRLAPDNIDAIIGLARAESLHMDKDGSADMLMQAQADYQAALASRPTAELYTQLGILLDKRQDRAAAINAYRKALDLNSQFLPAELGYGEALVNIGDFDNAIDVFSRACAQSRADHPGTSGGCGSVAIAAERGWAYVQKGDCRSLSLAEKDFREAAALEPGDADLHFRLGHVLMGEGILKESNCGHSEREREAYFDQAWSQLRVAVNLDSANALYREEFVALSEILKRKPEYDGGTLEGSGNPPSDFPLTLTIDKTTVVNFAEKHPGAIFQADQMGMAPPIYVIVFGSINGKKHWHLSCHRENSHGESNPCTDLAPGNYPGRWVHNRELLQLVVKDKDGPGWRFL